uniref:Chloride channel CLIC-like protein 1 n=1 Tax=Ascaris lumbricoides TaxID=6252 RepID=A0A0M3I034_ASCLU
MLVISILSAVMIYVGSAVENVDVDLTVDRTGWKDPLDPFSPYQEYERDIEKLRNCEEQLKLCRRGNNDIEDPLTKTGIGHVNGQDDPALKLIIRNILSRLHVDIDRDSVERRLKTPESRSFGPQEFVSFVLTTVTNDLYFKVTYVDRLASVFINTNDVETIRRYLNSEGESVSLREQIRVILEGFIVQQDLYSEPSFPIRFGTAISPYLPLLNLGLLVPAVVVLLSSRHSSRSLFFMVFSTAFLVSLFVVYNRKYQENVAARIARSKMAIADHCKPKGLISEALNILGGLVFIKGKSECLQYHEDLFVDPLYEISPLDVVCDVLSNFIFTPLGIFGRHFNVFFNEFYRDSPIPLVLVKTVLFVFLTISILFWACGYRLRTIFATLEPASVTPSLRGRSASRFARPTAVEGCKEQLIETTVRKGSAPKLSASVSCRSRPVVRRDSERSPSQKRTQSVVECLRLIELDKVKVRRIFVALRSTTSGEVFVRT